jgi:signal transduction histidine kinase/CheY-like chemotaxis protein
MRLFSPSSAGAASALRAELRAIIGLLAAYLVVGGSVSFLGWVLDAPALTDWLATGISIQPNTALATTLTGIGLASIALDWPRVTLVAGALVLLIGGATIFQYTTRIDLAIDQLFMFDRTWGRTGVLSPGRMGPLGASCWTAIGTALLCARRPPGSPYRKVVVGLSLVTAGLSSLSLVGYLYGASSLYALPTLTAIALQTATFIFVASTALICAVPEHGPMRILNEGSATATMLHRLLPVLILAPVALGMLHLGGERAGLYDTAFSSALRTLVEIAVFVLLIWRTSVAIGRQARHRKDAEDEQARLLVREQAARAEAERQATAKDEFLATVSHELRTPLNAILGWAHVLALDPADPSRVRHGIDVIERNGRVQAQLIADLLDMSRILTGNMRLDVQRLDLESVIESAIEAIRPAADAKDILIERVIEPLPSINGDPARLQQVVWNLLSNAVKFTPRGGRVQTVLARADSHVEIRVADSGEGIAPEFLPHVFERFRQADASPSRIHGGLGLGLALVKQLVELHGGRVFASSDGLGKGARFVVELPVEITQKTDDTMLMQPRAAIGRVPVECQVELSGIEALVVDDEVDAVDVIGRLLIERHATVTTALNTDDALELLRARRFDVIISDIGMPGRDGYELIRACRASGITSPAIALTAFARSDDRTRALMAGYQSHLAKPVLPDELFATVASLTYLRTGSREPN